MSGAISAAAILTTAATVYNGIEQRRDARDAAAKATANARKTAAQAERDTNAANARSPDLGAMLAGNQQAAKAGAGSTMLTGAQGVDASQLTLSKNTLLGG